MLRRDHYFPSISNTVFSCVYSKLYVYINLRAMFQSIPIPLMDHKCIYSGVKWWNRCKSDHFQCNSIPFAQQIDLTPPMNMHTFNQSNWIFKMIRKLQFWPLTIFSISFCVICLWVYTINASNFNLNWNFNSRLIFTSQTPISLNMLHIQYLR